MMTQPKPRPNPRNAMMQLRPCGADDADALYAIINAAAARYRGEIPADCWHEPYMTRTHLLSEMDDGVAFYGAEDDGTLQGVMGIQNRRDVQLIRHAYVLPDAQGKGIGGQLIRHLQSQASTPMLVGTWRAASWAIRFYEKQGFSLLNDAEKNALLRRYWSIPERQIETSVVLRYAP